MHRSYEGMPSRNLVSATANAMQPNSHVPRSRFIGKKTVITAFNAGVLIPIFFDEILPGDHMRYNCLPFVRMNTPVFPLFSNQRVSTFWFFCPTRLLWANFQRFMGEQPDPSSSINFTTPQISSAAGGFTVASLFDYLELPTVGQTDAAGVTTVNAFASRMYNRVYDAWFRDQNLVGAVVLETDDGPDTLADYPIRRRAKTHDRFTDALPWAQKFTAPTIPLGGLAPIRGLAVPEAATGADDGSVKETARGSVSYNDAFSSASTTFYIDTDGTSTLPKVYADLATASAITINTLRQAWLVQSLLEQNARSGTRYIEIIKAQFDVTVPDFRLMRPEYIGGGNTPINISPIAQTAPTTGLTVGALGAAAVGQGQHQATYAAQEHGYVMAIINVQSELAYQQGVPRHFKRQTRYEFYTPILAGLGEQAILRNEIYHKGLAANDDAVFGYAPAWDDYRQMYSTVTGRMRSTAATTIDPWHLAQNFSAAPTLNQTFIEDTPPMDRVLAAGATAGTQSIQYLAEILIERDAVRPIPTYGIPATLGRF